MTQTKEVEEELRKANRYLEEFAYVASHDLQEPLRMVGIYTQLLTTRVAGSDPELDEFAGFIQSGVARMWTLLSDLLEFSRTMNAKKELAIGTADLEGSFTQALSVLQTAIGESNALIHKQSLPRCVRGDTQQMSHVFQNLISNALKYRDQSRRPELHISSQRTVDGWNVIVQDNGIGFEPEYASRIFGLFKRLHTASEYPGTGVGLAICERIIERYGGRIWAEGTPGEGAKFVFAVPTGDEQNIERVTDDQGFVTEWTWGEGGYYQSLPRRDRTT